MLEEQTQLCIDACHACAVACNYCAASCLAEDDAKTMAQCISLSIDCAQTCELTASAMARGTSNMAAIWRLCIALCDVCDAECVKHWMEHCQRCAEACRFCAQQCRRMASTVDLVT